MKLWVDDIRTPPDDTWEWFKTSEGVITFIKYGGRAAGVSVMSLDHDLGGEDTTRPIVMFMCETGWWPVKVVVHSANPVGREWLEGMIERYKP